jgi:RHS repeat-associated protein
LQIQKNVSAITYNHLNLPTLITFNTGNSIEFLYDAVGTKLRKTVKVGATVQYVQDYLSGGIEYRQNGTGVKRVESVFHVEGRYFNTNVDASNTLAWRREYNIKDHLGNTRVVISDRNANGVLDITSTASTSDVLQENHYYAFGLGFEGPWLQNDAASRDNKYQYNGKELNDDFGLNWNDYGARWYDAAVGRWNGVDPSAQKKPSLTGYRVFFNNPIRFIDPNGKYELPANLVAKYPMFASYLKNNVEKDVMNSRIILQAFANNTSGDSPKKIGNLNRDEVQKAVKWGSGPKINIVDAPGGSAYAEGYYDNGKKEIQLRKSRLDDLEKVLQSDAPESEKLEALLSVYMTLLHETVHYGDYLDGIQQGGPEPGIDFEDEAWLTNEVDVENDNGSKERIRVVYFFGKKYTVDMRMVIGNRYETEEGRKTLPTVPEKLKP